MLRKITSIDFQSNNNTSQFVLIRVDFNVPVENDLVVDDYRILKSLPTIQYCLDQGAKVVLCPIEEGQMEKLIQTFR